MLKSFTMISSQLTNGVNKKKKKLLVKLYLNSIYLKEKKMR